ncbi:HU family DNA-binding protein [Agathobaculum massiliense]|uniref:HU family DNA-binding protein n=1 Tax=Agathobaculum massiliense TaxID=3014267 RepID=UPI000D1D94D0|nr:HU family DNA-binding protein [Agathobaculum massiliense]
MQKREFIDRISAKTGLMKKDSERIMDALFETLQEILSEGGWLMVNGFGTFETKERAARVGHKPRTGETVEIPAATVPVFKPSQALKDKLKRK